MSDEKINRKNLNTDNPVMQEFIENAKAAGIHILSDEEKKQQCEALLSNYEFSRDDCWIFAYGSLMWNPVIKFIDSRSGILKGWHRDFCIDLPMGRGTLQNPGLMMGLASGGSCYGKVYRLPPGEIDEEIKIFWQREINTNIYIPKWLSVETEQGDVRALALTVDTNNKRYRLLEIDKKAAIIAKASGQFGTNRDYLFKTLDSLKQLNVNDENLEKLALKVKNYLK